MNEFEKAIENLSHSVSACNRLDWKLGETPEPYLLEAAREVLEAAARQAPAPAAKETEGGTNG